MLHLDPDGMRRDPLLPRPMAIYRGSDGEAGSSEAGLEFRFKVVGRGTTLLAELRPGSALGVVGPLGNGFPVPQGRPLLVGGGTGIASLYQLARDTVAARDGRVLLGGRTSADVPGLDDFRALGLGAGLELATDDGSEGRHGLVTDLLEPKPGDEIFACGPTAMMRCVSEIAQAAAVPCWVSLENTMACGFGICLGCGVALREAGDSSAATGRSFRYVCTDGPVFDALSLDWQALP